MEQSKALLDTLKELTAIYHDHDLSVYFGDETHVDKHGEIVIQPHLADRFPTVDELNEFRLLTNDLSQQVEQLREARLSGKTAFANAYREDDAVDLAKLTINTVEDAFVGRKRLERLPGKRSTEAMRADLLMKNDGVHPPLDAAAFPREVQIAEGISQLRTAGYVKGIEGADPDIQRFLSDASLRLDTARMTDDAGERERIAHGIMLDALDLRAVDEDDLADEMSERNPGLEDQHSSDAVKDRGPSTPHREAAEEANRGPGDGDGDDGTPGGGETGDSTPGDRRSDETPDGAGDTPADSPGERSDDATASTGDRDADAESGDEAGATGAGRSTLSKVTDSLKSALGKGDESDPFEDASPETRDEFQRLLDAALDHAERLGGDALSAGPDAPTADEMDGGSGMPGSIEGLEGDGDDGAAAAIEGGPDELIPGLESRFMVPGGTDIYEPSGAAKRRFAAVKKALDAWDADIPRRLRERDERIEYSTGSSARIRKKREAKRLIEDIEDEFRRLQSARRDEAAEAGYRIHRRNATRRLSGDYGVTDLYHERGVTETGDRVVGVALDISGSMSGSMDEAKMAVAAIATAAESLGDEFVATAFTTDESGHPSAGDRIPIDLRIITGPDEEFEWEHLDSIEARCQEPTALGIRDCRSLMDEVPARESLMFVITDGKAHVDADEIFYRDSRRQRAVDDARATVNIQRSEGVRVIGIGIGSMHSGALRSTFGSEYIATDIKHLSDELVQAYRAGLETAADIPVGSY